MDHEFSLAYLTLLECSPAKMIDIAERTGYQYVSLRLTPVAPHETIYPLTSDKPLLREVIQRLSDSEVRVLDIELARLGPAELPEDYIRALETGAALGARHVICQLPDADRARASEKFGRLCELAAPFNLTVDLEFPSWTETSCLADAVFYLKKTGQKNAGILVDILHFARSNSSIGELATLPPEWFHFVHLCDAVKTIPDTTEELIDTARSNREFPGKGELDVLGIVGAMPRVPYSLEIPNEGLLTKLGPAEYARQAIKTARDYLSAPEIFADCC